MPQKEFTLEHAVALAAQAHEGQVDKAGLSYILHPLRVMLSLAPSAQLMRIGVCHDLVEDTEVSLSALSALGMPDEELSALDALTRRRDEPYETFIERVATNPLAVQVKLADLADNLNAGRLPSMSAEDERRMERYRAARECLLKAQRDGR